jgi:hypothetical protein
VRGTTFPRGLDHPQERRQVAAQLERHLPAPVAWDHQDRVDQQPQRLGGYRGRRLVAQLRSHRHPTVVVLDQLEQVADVPVALDQLCPQPGLPGAALAVRGVDLGDVGPG